MLTDIWDGAFLQELVHKRFFSSNLDLAFFLSTDGVALFKSSSMSLWPVYLVILNLPPEVRMNASNIMLAGLWVGPTKPLMKLLLDPILSSLKNLSTDGIMINTPNGMQRLKGKLVMGLFDLPAKAAVLCAKQYNGLHGCSVCLHPGKRLSNNSNVYPPEPHEMRTHAGVISAAQQALETGTVVEGIMQLSPLASELNLVDSVPTDYMHATLEGVMKMLLNYWTKSTNHNKPYYVGRQIGEIDKELMKQRPPSEFSRPPRSLEKHLSYWKASEFRNWMLYYSLPLLLGKLPSLYWHHYSLLVCAIHILLKDRISLAEIDAAEKMLNDFYALVPELYGEAACTHNVHLLSHLCKYVRLWGPLWTHSLFGFESKNGQLKHLFHGKQNIFQQLLFNIDIGVALQLMRNSISGSQVNKYIAHVNHTALRKNMTFLYENCYIIGSTNTFGLSSVQKAALQISDDTCEVFSRLFKKGVVYYSTLYMKNRMSKRENTYCTFIIDNNIGYGHIIFFVVKPVAKVLVNVINIDTSSLMETSGNPCRAQLVMYKDIDFISTFIKPINNSATSHCH